MGRNPERLLDKTFLSIDTAEERGLVHRDYIAHCFRWSHVVKHLNQKHRYKDAVVLDVGCGKELPLAKLMYVNKMTPLQYVGVDANKTAVPNMLKERIPIKLWFDTDFCNLDQEDVGHEDGLASSPSAYTEDAAKAYDQGESREIRTGFSMWTHKGKVYRLPNVLACFEVLEHVTPAHCRRMLQHMLKVTSDDCHYFISTPCYNGSAAENHINEMVFGALGSLLEDVGFNINGVWGTFASIRDYESELGNWTYYYEEACSKGAKSYEPRTLNLLPLFEALSTYYDTNALSTIFAPIFPANSRNCLWHLTKAEPAARVRKFVDLEQTPGPWSQHPNWKELAG